MEETRSPREATDAAPEETRSPVSTPCTRLFRVRRRRNALIVPLPVTLAEIERFEKASYLDPSLAPQHLTRCAITGREQLQQDAPTELLLNYSSTRAATRVCRDRDVGVWCNLQVLALSTEYS